MVSPIDSHYTNTATVKRMKDVGATEKQTLKDVYTDIPCHVQPLDDSFSETYDGGYGKDFLMFTDSRDIQQGDRVEINSQEYRVMSVERFAFLKRPRHMECRIRIFKNSKQTT